MVNTFHGVCKVLDKLQKLEDISAYISGIGDDDDLPFVDDCFPPHSATTATAESAKSVTAVYPKIRNICLHDYNILSLKHADDILHIKTFPNLTNMNISFSDNEVAAKLYDLLNSTVLDYIHKVIPSCQITAFVGQDDDACPYLDFYCNGLQNIRGDSSSRNNPKFCVYISFWDDENVGDKYLKHSMIKFKKNAAAMDGEIYYYINENTEDTIRSQLAKRFLQHHNDLVTEIAIDNTEGNRWELNVRITRIGNQYSRCQTLCIIAGAFINSPSPEDGLPNRGSTHNITKPELGSCWFNKGVLSRFISPQFPYLKECKLKDCDYRDTQEDPFTTTIELANTAIDTLILLDNINVNHVDHGLICANVDYKSNLVLLSISSIDQDFSRSYLCTPCENGTVVDEISNEMISALEKTLDSNYNSFVKINAKYIKNLVLRIDGDSNDRAYFDVSFFPSIIIFICCFITELYFIQSDWIFSSFNSSYFHMYILLLCSNHHIQVIAFSETNLNKIMIRPHINS